MTEAVALPGGRQVEISVHRYPVDAPTRARLIDLLQQVFPRTDVDWLQSMRGSYADVLTTCQIVGTLDGDPVSNASVAFAKDRPEVCVIEDVLTAPAARGLGIARRLTERAVQIAFDAGCRVAYLGNVATKSSVYEHVGFTRLRGVVMRRPAAGSDAFETAAFAPGQAALVRETNWGDLPGVVCLMAQPTGPTLTHFDQGLVSLRDAAPQRAVSNFTSVKYAAENSGGNMWSLVSAASPHRVFGFASIVPGPGPLRDHTARCDVTCHDHYADGVAALIGSTIRWAQQHAVSLLEACTAEADTAKRAWFAAAGFAEVARIPNVLHINNQPSDVLVLHRSCA